MLDVYISNGVYNKKKKKKKLRRNCVIKSQSIFKQVSSHIIEATLVTILYTLFIYLHFFIQPMWCESVCLPPTPLYLYIWLKEVKLMAFVPIEL